MSPVPDAVEVLLRATAEHRPSAAVRGELDPRETVVHRPALAGPLLTRIGARVARALVRTTRVA